ncbi:hypothetical protein [Streptomyces chumphonensis]|uniref:hypothetical protein n=1 Tax=Streptomyces chumphonensis TaxID=1214925 RepID=UPI003D733940
MAHHPQSPGGSPGNQDPAGSTQMFRAFVDEGGPRRAAATQPSGGNRTALIVGVVLALAAVAAVLWVVLG